GVIGSPSTIHAKATVITGEHWVMRADRHDSTWRCDQITRVCPTKPGTSATPQIATQSRADGHAGIPWTRIAAGVMTSAAASITHAKKTIGSTRSRTLREKNQYALHVAITHAARRSP